MKKLREYFIGDIIKNTDDVFETARDINLLYFCLIFNALFPTDKYIDKEMKKNKNEKI